MKAFFPISFFIILIIACDPLYTTKFIFKEGTSITTPTGEIIKTDMSFDELIVIVDSICIRNNLINDGTKLTGYELVAWHGTSDYKHFFVGIIPSDSLSKIYDISIMSFISKKTEMTQKIKEELEQEIQNYKN